MNFCRSSQQFDDYPYIHELTIQCANEILACIETKEQELMLSNEEARDVCDSIPLPIDPDYVGPCPVTLMEVEGPKYDSIGGTFARMYARDRFKLVKGIEKYTRYFYKEEETIEELKAILELDPYNPLALSGLANIYAFRDDNYQSLRYHIRDMQSDPYCEQSWGLNLSINFRYTDDMIQSMTSGTSTGLNFTQSEYELLLVDIWQASVTTYDIAFERTEGYKKSMWAIASIHTPMIEILSEAKIDNAVSFDPPIENWLETRQLELKYKFGSVHTISPGTSFDIAIVNLCNDYAYELGMFDECLKHIQSMKFSKHTLSKSRESFIFDSVLALAISVTRSCKNPLGLLLPEDHGWRKGSVCLADRYNELKTTVRDIIDNKTSLFSGHRIYLLNSYLSLDEGLSTVGFYELALQMNQQAILHALRLAKRLQQRNEADQALKILDLSIDLARESNLDYFVFNEENERYFEAGFTFHESILDDRPGNHVLAQLIDHRTKLSHGLPLDIHEQPYTPTLRP